MAIQFPSVSTKVGLGLGLDMPWGDLFGFDPMTQAPSPRVEAFLKKNKFDCGFLSSHPKSRGTLNAKDYFKGFDRFFELGNFKTRSLHHTFLNLATMEDYETDRICEFTNELIDRYGFSWVNEDLGIWSMNGKTLPYPLPPFLNAEGFAACVRNIRSYQARLAAPLLIEFPGFTEGTNFFIGKMDGFEFFRELAQETSSPVTLDTGHLISYEWLRGKRGAELFTGLDRLPLEHCFEIHLSGCQILNDRFMDFHHGIIMDEQIELLEILLKKCPNVRVVTFEDPKFTESGDLIPKAVKNFERLKEIVGSWMQRDDHRNAPLSGLRAPSRDDLPAVQRDGDELVRGARVRELYELLHSPQKRAESLTGDFETIDREQLEKTANRILDTLLGGNHQGSKGLRAIFEDTFEYWKLASGQTEKDLIQSFVQSTHYEKYSEMTFARPGLGIEESFYHFIAQDICGEPHPLEEICRNEFLLSLYKTLTQGPPAFQVGEKWVQNGRSVQIYTFRLKEGELEKIPHFVLYAARPGRLISGEITPLVADLLYDEDAFGRLPEVSRRFGVDMLKVFGVYQSLSQIGLVKAIQR